MRLHLVALGLAILALSGCDSQCRQACRHMIEDCGVDKADYGVDDCASQCGAFLTHYEDQWQETQAWEAVSCVQNAACEDLRTGTPCYSEAVYIW
jgi:hypothetical protein